MSKRRYVRLSELQNRDKDGGLVCRKCGCRHFYTLRTEPASLGRIRRRKACRHCGHRITTYEQVGGGGGSATETQRRGEEEEDE
jgi:DNA-directed RNA polymerase subunit RPC12/RpoP